MKGGRCDQNQRFFVSHKRAHTHARISSSWEQDHEQKWELTKLPRAVGSSPGNICSRKSSWLRWRQPSFTAHPSPHTQVLLRCSWHVATVGEAAAGRSDCLVQQLYGERMAPYVKVPLKVFTTLRAHVLHLNRFIMLWIKTFFFFFFRGGRVSCLNRSRSLKVKGFSVAEYNPRSDYVLVCSLYGCQVSPFGKWLSYRLSIGSASQL